MADPVCVRTFETRSEAEFVKQLLEAESIPATVWADDGGGLFVQHSSVMHSPYRAVGVRLYVPAEFAERAEECLRVAREGSGEDEIDPA